MIRPHLILYFFGFLFYNHSIWSQDLEIRTYTSLDGLSENLLTCFYQDQYGYLWIGTIHGLDRYDGTKFQTFSVRNGMPSLWCNQLLEDHTGRLWIATRNGMAEFRKDSFYVYPTTDQIHPTYVSQLYENAYKEIIANTREGQYKFNGQAWEPYAILNQNNKDVIGTVVRTSDGEYAITGTELFYKNNKGNITRLQYHPDQGPFFKQIESIDDHAYVNMNAAIYLIDSLHQKKLFPNELKDKTVLSFYKSTDDQWWISTKEDGLLVLQQKNGYVSQQKVKTPFASITIGKYFEDRDNQVWATYAYGLMKILPPSFSKMKINEVSTGEHIRNVFPYGKNQLFVSISDGKLLLIRYDTDKKTSYEILQSYILELPNDFVDNYAIDLNQGIWMTTRNAQLYYYREGKLENKTNLIREAGQPFAAGIACGTQTDKIIIALDSVLTFVNDNTLDTLFDADHTYIKFPRQVLFVDKECLAIKTLDNEVFLYAPDKENQFHFTKTHASSSWGRYLYKDHHSNLWIYNAGENVSEYKIKYPSGADFELVDIIKDSPENINTLFYDFIADDSGSLWCTTNRGIQHLFKTSDEKWASKQYTVYEMCRQANTDWYHIAESGDHIWVNLQNELICFNSDISETLKKTGNVILEEVQLQNQRTNWTLYSDSLTTYFEIPVNPKLKYDQNSLTFIFNSPTTIENPGTQYAYRLLPADTVWSQASVNNSVSYNQLKPAQYLFQIRSHHRGEEWSNPTLFSFTIAKPIWETTWFRILILLMVSTIVAWIFRIRLKQERAKGEIKGQMLELEMRALRAQMNPHFIYNALNSIQSLVATNQTSSANKYISKFARLLRQVLENSKRSEISLRQELESLRLYVDLEKLRLDEDVKFVETVDESIFPETIHVPPLVLQPFIENALWHGLSSKKGEKKIELSIRADKEWIHFSITDNGIGRQKASMLKSQMTQHESTAIQNTIQRLRDFNGSIHSDPLKIEDLYLPDGTPAGTRIWLHIRKKTSSGLTVQ
ncbi:MAG TPA: histidine kinase [Saprospiraceae bacterium]|nr:histidine kinase [Saprospiraceae bacterium]